MDQSSVVAPPRSLDQRMEALARANDIRAKRAQFKKDIKAGVVDPARLLAEPPECLMTMKVIDLIAATPKFGVVKTARLLADCRVSAAKTVGGLSDRQRSELVEAFKARRAQIGLL